MFQFDNRTIFALHFFLVAPLLIYIGRLGMQGQIIPPQYYQMIMAVGILVAAYHGMVFCKSYKLDNMTKDKGQ